jgi:hypothetical protein
MSTYALPAPCWFFLADSPTARPTATPTTTTPTSPSTHHHIFRRYQAASTTPFSALPPVDHRLVRGPIVSLWAADTGVPTAALLLSVSRETAPAASGGTTVVARLSLPNVVMMGLVIRRVGSSNGDSGFPK